MAYLKKLYTITLISLCCNQAMADEPLELFPDKPIKSKIKQEEKITKNNVISITKDKALETIQLKQVDIRTNTLPSINNSNSLAVISHSANLDINVPKLGESKADELMPDKIESSFSTFPSSKIFATYHASLWDRIRAGFKIPNLETTLTDNRTEWYAQRPEYFARINDRAQKYLYHIVEELEKRNMPTELALLPIIESAFNPVANSSVKAAGIWQFMPKTGKYFNLQQNMFIDERRDVLSSTSAALDYLEKLHTMFGDWHLALAAYNWGEGSVSRAIAKNQAKGLPTDYLSLNMPLETKYYVPKLQAVKNIIANPLKYNINLTDIPNHAYFVTIVPTKDIDVETMANLAEISLIDFKAINPSYNKKVIISSIKPQILLPWDKAEKFKLNLQNYKLPLSSVTAITLTNKEKVESLAQKFGVEASEIRSINNIGKGFRFKAGSTVLMPKVGSLQDDISEHIAENGSIRTEKDTPNFKRIYIYAKKKDTLSNIAKRYDIELSKLTSWNKFGAHLKKGQRLTLILPYNQTIYEHKQDESKNIEEENFSTKLSKSHRAIKYTKKHLSKKEKLFSVKIKKTKKIFREKTELVEKFTHKTYIKKNKHSNNIHIAESRHNKH